MISDNNIQRIRENLLKVAKKHAKFEFGKSPSTMLQLCYVQETLTLVGAF